MSSTTTTTDHPPPAPCSSFPFQTVVITFPDAAAAQAASSSPLTTLKSQYPHTTFIATADPYNARVGSGGGTAAALYDHIVAVPPAAAATTTEEQPLMLTQNVLILHAGGAASRCPTQMCLGKAWTSLPTKSKSTTRSLQTPLELWLHTCHSLFASIPQGTVVVIAADTLLQWTHSMSIETIASQIDWMSILTKQQSTVIGLAVPAILSTAKNHGVFVVQQNNDDNSADCDGSTIAQVRPCHAVLQKPSISTMESHPQCCFVIPKGGHHQQQQHDKELQAWIDTGVTIFSPIAAQSLCTLTQEHLSRCTACGLQTLYNAQQYPMGSSSSSIEEFAAQNALSVDLYTHLMQALTLFSSSDITVQEDSTRKKQVYLEQYQHEVPIDILTAIWDTMSQSTLQIATISYGRFWHLGTTRELQRFLIDATTTKTTTPTSSCGIISVDDAASMIKRQQCREFGQSLGLTRRLRAYTPITGSVDPSAVIYHSLLIVSQPQQPPNVALNNNGHQTSFIGADTVVEHCHVELSHPKQCLQIGQNCLISGLRSLSSSSSSSSTEHCGIYIPDNTMVLMVRLKESLLEIKEPSLVVVVLGMDDNVKNGEVIYGKSLNDFFRATKLAESDLWASKESRTLWTAKLHPIISLQQLDGYASVYTWLHHYVSNALDIHDATVESDPSFLQWKSSRRLSLSEIRDVADAPLEFLYREELTNRLKSFKADFDRSLETTVRERQHTTPLDLQFLVDEYLVGALGTDQAGEARGHNAIDMIDTFSALDVVVEQFICSPGRQDISARAGTLISGLLEDLAAARAEISQRPPSNEERIAALLQCILDVISSENISASDAQNVMSSLAELVSVRNVALETYDVKCLATISHAMDCISSALTGKHVLGARGMASALKTQLPILDTWILASAPARIDLSGGWSDTPPICYEHGSQVVGMAITIDDRLPLAARCRIVSGKTGILLRSEARSIESGELLSAIEAEIYSWDDLSDCRDPTADCALLKCCLVHLGLTRQGDSDDFQSTVNDFCQSETTVRLEVIATTLLPQGSGLGTSSILAGCILAAVGKCIGAGRERQNEYDRDIIDSVLNVEQYLTTGGGFQDQVNGLIGGIKLVSTVPNVNPMTISFETLSVTDAFRNKLNSHFVLAFTGKTRLAKNLLRQVLQRWSRQTPEIMRTMAALVKGAAACSDAIISSDLDVLGMCISEYWVLKKIMAGPSSGVEPQVVNDVIDVLTSRRLVRGAALCGAGGGGFMVLLCADGVNVSDLQGALQSSPLSDSADVAAFAWHTCKLCDHGLKVESLPEEPLEVASFDISWLSADRAKS